MDDNRAKEHELLFELGSTPISDRDFSSYKDAPGVDFEDKHQRAKDLRSKTEEQALFKEAAKAMGPSKKE